MYSRIPSGTEMQSHPATAWSVSSPNRDRMLLDCVTYDPRIRAQDSLSQPCERDHQGQLHRSGKLIHHLKRRRVQSKYHSRQQTQDGRTAIDGKCAENKTHCEDDRNGVAGQVLNGRRQPQRGLHGRSSARRDSRNRSAGRTLRIAERWRSPVTGRMTRGTPSFQTVESGRVMPSSPR